MYSRVFRVFPCIPGRARRARIRPNTALRALLYSNTCRTSQQAAPCWYSVLTDLIPIRKLQRYTIPGIPGIPGIPVYSRYSRVFRVFPVLPGITRYSRVFRVFPVFRYSRVFPVFPGIPGYPGIPVYSLYSLYSLQRRAPARPIEPRGPFWPCGVALSTPLSMTGVVYGGGYPPGHAPGACPGGYTTPVHHPGHAQRGAQCHTARSERASGLNGPRGLRVGRGRGRKAAPLFPYLRSFLPGIPDRLQPVWGNRWIGSRAPWALGPRDVSDLERLRSRCGRAGSGDRREPDPANPAGSVSLRSTDPAVFVFRLPWTLF